MVVDPAALRTALVDACADAGIDPGTVVVWIVAGTSPPGATPIAYLQPAASVRAETVQVFRAVGAERAAAFAGRAHRIAVWRDLPRIPDDALGPMLRHELAHAVRWEASGTAFYEADERLRTLVGAAAYRRLPTELEANAAAAAYARSRLGDAGLAALGSVPELSGLLAAELPADVVGDTLALLGERIDAAPERVEGRAEGPLIEVVAPAGAASGGMP